MLPSAGDDHLTRILVQAIRALQNVDTVRRALARVARVEKITLLDAKGTADAEVPVLDAQGKPDSCVWVCAAAVLRHVQQTQWCCKQVP